ncbi:hypothetical protein SAMN05216359_11968 [Roseateles sp. YR242]|uniref:hypothetical protein n=1 Tax=Roseateles sp. YR242 TaxID=1855305 RepID=UPI0008C28A37|nr:hypothetical protein [Roseateles sp. YR242]SEL84969.1 hypothetical protein SAMN05216359_11968 [Roseateles sp. YR242]
MQHISPVKIVAGIAAIILAVTVVFYGSKARQGVSDILSVTRVRAPAASTQTSPQADVGARPSGTRVIPIGVVAQPSSGPSHKDNQ